MEEYVVGIGEALWDVLPDGKRLGGAPANFAYHASQFGLRSCVVSAVGKDAPGDEMVEELAAKGVGLHVERVDKPTGQVTVSIDGAGIPHYRFDRDSAWDNIPFTPQLERLAAHTRAVCFGSLAQRGALSRATIGRFLDAMPQEEDVLRVFDINLRQDFYSAEIAEESLQRCNILKINDEELAVVARMFGLPGRGADHTCRILRERYGLKVLILTCGADGSRVFTPDAESFLATPRVEVADTVGAGDSFTAAFVSSLLRGRQVAEAHRIAVEVSAYVCTQHGAMPRLPECYTK